MHVWYNYNQTDRLILLKITQKIFETYEIWKKNAHMYKRVQTQQPGIKEMRVRQRKRYKLCKCFNIISNSGK